MTTSIATTKEQSEELLRCGVSADTADMCWIAPNRLVTGGVGFPTLMCTEYFKHDDLIQQTPAWSLSALLQLFPKVIKKDGITYKLNIDYPPIGQVAIRYNTEEDDLNSLIGLMGDDLIDLIVGLVKRKVKREIEQEL